ncbi:hypothetical protein V7148_22115 [Gottfriedia acidiceleris]|uniref:hypothetical protein n=1 Tax=Bacillaceae TaxID=186817 RepID=UPI000BEE6EC7|nr:MULTISPECIES: hypothetical protein [unclassified Bacillus (in: firmicutes)]PEC50305.1 hypothetical protein CON00_06775 [Bacillus sp. AFS096315]PFM74939.1 hypothetical protein COJ46_22675 [Bacillus sp. AFS077874]
MINSISKPKIPKNYKYILKTSQLEEVLKENKCTIHVDLEYWLPQKIGNILEVHYWLPNSNVPYSRLYIRAGALDNKDVHEAREVMIKTVYPEFIKWLEYYLKLPENAPQLFKKPYFCAVYEENKVKFSSNSY